MDRWFELRPRFPILYVEDEEDDIHFMRQAFQKAGIAHPLQIVRDGQQAIDYLAGSGPYADREAYPFAGLVLLDLKLTAGVSGFEVLQWVRQNPLSTNLMVITFSSGVVKDIHRAYELGANGYVEKPADFEQLVALVEAIRDYWLKQNLPAIGGV